jgi:hypothetical protein
MINYLKKSTLVALSIGFVFSSYSQTSMEDVDRRLNDKDKNDRYNQWLKNLSKDIYLDQAVKVIGDIQNQRNLAKSPLNKEKPVKSF